MTTPYRICGLFCAVVLLSAGAAQAWTRPGHMVTAGIAYLDLAEHDPDVIERIAALLALHPDRGPFEVAAGRALGDERTRRLMLECARWPDDARGTHYDHPSWHVALRSIRESGKPDDKLFGDAIEAFALNAHLLASSFAPDADRAVALCWLMHIAGDMHQPLHSAQRFTPQFPDGDHGGALEFVKDPQTGEPITLHWFWDDSVNRNGEPDAVMTRARELWTKLPRSSFKELSHPVHARDFPSWAQDESYPLAVSLAYRQDLRFGATKETATALDPKYVEDATQAAEKRLTLSGYRLADLLREALKGTPLPQKH
ncbi:MAG TPA: S1/P1 nuclease [Myxococcota bacterium]|nr:S1/P1 nuclease [Myxococcota bacterium]